MLCGFAYAKQMGAQIINASLGFYLPRLELLPKKFPVDPNVKLLREYIRYYLTANKILLITAAGNQDDREKRIFEEHKFQIPELVYPTDWRSLDQISFYPASLARDPDFPNVIAVTTVNYLAGKVSPAQNYSNKVVDVGVNADAVRTGSTDRYMFYNPLTNNKTTSEGSSFATPIFTGKLTTNYELIRNVITNTRYQKSDIWTALGAPHTKVIGTLSGKIKSGRYTVK